MIGLAYLVLGAIYVVAMVCLVGWAWRKGRKLNRSVAIACATLAFLSLYLPVFWDFIPTIIAHRYYCAKDAGTVIGTDPEQWINQHSNEIAELRIDPLNRPQEFEYFTTQDGWEGWYPNKAVMRRHRIQHVGWAIVVQRLETQIVDLRTHAILASQVDYQTGRSFASGSYKVWNYSPTCDSWKSQSPFEAATTKYELRGK